MVAVLRRLLKARRDHARRHWFAGFNICADDVGQNLPVPSFLQRGSPHRIALCPECAIYHCRNAVNPRQREPLTAHAKATSQSTVGIEFIARAIVCEPPFQLLALTHRNFIPKPTENKFSLKIFSPSSVAVPQTSVHPRTMEPNVPVFGQRSGEALKKTRECAYAVVINCDGLVAGTRDGDHIHLPGGGVDFPETPTEAIHREVREEIACKVNIGERIGQALHYIPQEDGFAAHYATFYAAELGDSTNSTARARTHLGRARILHARTSHVGRAQATAKPFDANSRRRRAATITSAHDSSRRAASSQTVIRAERGICFSLRTQ